MQRAHVNKGLIVTLCVLVVIVGGYWAWQFASEPKIVVDPNAPEATYNLVCDACKKTSTIKSSEIRSPERRDPETLQYKCEKCGKFAAKIERQSGGSVLPVSGGG